VLIALGAARTWTRNQDWRNERTLWAAAVAVAPGSARVQSEYGRVLAGLAEDAARAGRDGEAQRFYAAARQHYETALQIYPSYWQPMDGLAIVLSLQQRYDEALVLFEKAVRVYPRNFASLTNWGALLWERSLGTAARAAQLRAAGRVAEADELAREAEAGFRLAVEKVDQAIAIRPSYAHAHLIRALLLDDYLHDPGGAIAAFEEVLRLMPLHPQRQAIDDKLARLRALQASPVLERE
jgi:tetratricopeptide (TPR) repeat protein